MLPIADGVNALLAPFCILFLILFDYLRHRSTDKLQRKLFFGIVLACLVGIAAGFGWVVLQTVQGTDVRIALYVMVTLRCLMQIVVTSLLFVLLDYVVHRDAVHTKMVSIAIGIYVLVCAGILLGNYWGQYYFTVTPANAVEMGNGNLLQLVFVIFPVMFALVDLATAKYMPAFLWSHLVVFGLPTIAGALTDWLLDTKIFWSCQALIVLFAYLFTIRQDADRDPLTKLNNRRSLDEYLEDVGREGRKVPYTFIMMDLDRFKKVNDTYGHLEGDKVLRQFSQIVSNSVRHVDFAARFGGDEFCIIAKGLATPDRLICRVQNNLDIYNKASGLPYKIYFSYGSDVYQPGDARTPLGFLEHVDALLYENKAKQAENGKYNLPDEQEEE